MTPDPQVDQNGDALPSQPFVEHLIELRSRLVRGLILIAILLVPLVYFSNTIYEFVAEPLLIHLPEGSEGGLIVTDITAAFLTPFKLSFFVAIFLGMPFLLYQLWSFIAPALYQNEKALALPIFASSIVLFYAGVAFAYYVVMPMIFGFFTAVAPDAVTVMPDITSHLNLVIKLFFAFGLAFEIPVATVILIVAGVMTPDSLAKKRAYVIVSCFVIGMLLTPPDIFSQAMLAFPMWLLFEVGIFFGRIAIKARNKDIDDTEIEDAEIEE